MANSENVQEVPAIPVQVHEDGDRAVYLLPRFALELDPARAGHDNLPKSHRCGGTETRAHPSGCQCGSPAPASRLVPGATRFQ